MVTTNTKDTESAKPSRNVHNAQESRKDTDTDRTDSRPSPVEVLRQARAQLAELTGMAAESVTSFEQTEDGWSLEVEVLELARVPDTMSLMASYQVDLDPKGLLTGYHRTRRYERGRSDAHRPGGR
ncbi:MULTISPECIES: gas vesicle protein GvpO [Streptomyces]|uniref:gas vesicle protein GvpO n=1 Tax=Streptomyces TaxID=1883 RepID=UPI00292D8613|nr:gas vesicle protein [Streptomyces sp. NEAU-HV9]